MTATINTAWYDLFSRGARDWLRHNDKVRDAVHSHLPELIAGPDLITGPQDRTVQVPVRLLEHARFRLADSRSQTGAGQGVGQPGDVLQPGLPEQADDGGTPGEGGNQEGDVRLLLELPIDDVMDWVWEELKLPELKPRNSARIDEVELVREGWDKRGARSRLDRRRTVKEAIKRRAVQADPVPFTNDDLRFRQLVSRQRPSTGATILFVIDVSASMSEHERKLAKSFFFFALQGIRRQYARVETRFIAHTTHAWEFTESEFFQVTGTGGTMASSAFRLVLELIRTELDPAQNNLYMFYASDGENFTEDRTATSTALTELGKLLNYTGYIETLPGAPRTLETEMRRLCNELQRRGVAIGSTVLSNPDDVWSALRKFFVSEGEHAAKEAAP
ncbi:hypothetical protein CR152_23360 [Massilia violaceinigra]|uniref:DUF444 domain-containing protein n=1 Tax=Massilia violaceinigra TaxID=2045208 RepID=A0A2D2DQ66_9BURK|nr:DUF444 family protein [Massilia violaceinigra]ATQ77125.1 hypothetical protein CR152_23360 [Massilia violaceinigra]